MRLTLPLLLALTVSAYAGEDLVKTVSSGEAIDLKNILSKDKFTALEFYADW